MGSGGMAATPQVPCSFRRFQESRETITVAFHFIIKLEPALGEARTQQLGLILRNK